ncbi:MAG: hypothetical protein IIZ38_12500 [Sphingomonas sp.]|uniref:hypothetical protein n=1 Tax=unclassified Sphingomonas TaxID=196159 RepID=UPI00245707C3|nr:MULTISPECIES: hypothetical protein [unclassified Sphingomonas]MBQ1499127.1 hypothetical protein [Sphingomonas sp.]MDH4746090.1 hypothetical protein [Sphingomonas sp. CBMAI 2297]
MANLRNFVNPALNEGETFDVYLNRFPQIGSGKANALVPLFASFAIDASVLGHPIKGNIEIQMPDLSPSGTCLISFLGAQHKAPYTTGGGKLQIQAPGRTVTLYGGDKQWSWIDVSGVPGSIGIWPTSHVLRDEDEVDLAGAEA